MLPNAFIGKSTEPTEKELALELGSAKVLWDRLLDELAGPLGNAIHEWSSYSRKAGWSLKVKHGTRTILYLSPCHGSFRASFALSDRAVKSALHGPFPVPVLKMIREAKRYAEGTAVRIEVKAASDVSMVEKIAALKLEN